MKFDLKSRWEIISLAIILGFAAFLLVYQLPYWPATFYDEGINVQTAKNLALHGIYGIQSSGTFRLFDPPSSTGPTVLVPVALVIKLLGSGLTQARLVMPFFALLSLLAVYLLASHVFNSKTALLSLLLILGIPLFLVDDSASFFGLGRYVLGEIPAFLFISVGCLLWFTALSRQSMSRLLGAGIFFGLAVITKDYCLLIIAGLVLIWILDRIWYRQLQWKQVVIPIVVSILFYLMWSLVQVYLERISGSQKETFLYGVTFTAFAGLLVPTRIMSNLRVLLSSGIFIWGLPGLVYGIYLCKERSLLGLKRVFLLILSTIWLLWFVIGSIGWVRYAFLGICLMLVFTAKLFVDLFSGLKTSTSEAEQSNRADRLSREAVQKLAIALVIAILVITPLQEKTKQILSAPHTAALNFASYINSHVDSEDVIETLEAEIAFLSDNNFRQPSLYVLTMATDHAQFGKPYPADIFKEDEVNPKYIINGTLGKWTGLYDEWLASGRYELINTVADYDLYRAVDRLE